MRKMTAVILLLGVLAACAKPLATGTTYTMDSVGDTYSAGANAVYYGVRWALAARGYPVGYEDLQNGTVVTSWVPVKATSHYLQPFRSKDYGVNGAYHQLELRVAPSGGVTGVTVTSRVKSIVQGLHSSGEEERAVLQEIKNYLHGTDVNVTNVGVE